MTVIPFKLNPSRQISYAEKSIFAKAKLDSTFADTNCYLFHSLRIGEAENKLVGEVDFVYLDNEFMLFLEVKGGKVFYNSSTDTWSTQDGKSEKDPFYQVCSALFNVRDNKFPIVFKHRNFEKRLIFGYGILFPDCGLPSDFKVSYSKSHRKHKSDNIEYNLDLVYTSEFHHRPNGLAEYLIKIKEYWRQYPKYKDHRITMKNEEVLEIKNYFRRDLIFETPILDLLNYDISETEQYTKQQTEILEIVRINSGHGFLITGGPGTGKTLLAVEKTIQLIEEGRKVLFICYNRVLSSFLSHRIAKFRPTSVDNKGNAEVYTLHHFLLDVLKRQGIEVDIKNDNDFWQNELPKLFIDTFKSCGNFPEYDYLVIDEGQDIFADKYMECLNIMLKGGFDSGNYIIFLDKYYQSVYNSFSLEYYTLFKNSYKSIEFPLTKNCRNTPNIIDKAYYDTGMPKTECLKNSLLNPETFFFASHTDFINIINSKVHELLDKNVLPKKITVLTRRDLVDKVIESNPKLYRELNIDNFDKEEGKISVTTPHSFKGLENLIIIFAGYDKYDPDNELLMSNYYVGYTRAISHLIIILNKSVKENLESSIQNRIAKEIFKQ